MNPREWALRALGYLRPPRNGTPPGEAQGGQAADEGVRGGAAGLRGGLRGFVEGVEKGGGAYGVNSGNSACNGIEIQGRLVAL